MIKTCARCGIIFDAERDHYWLCSDCYYDSAPPEKCHGVKADGTPCLTWALHGEKYCIHHIGQAPAILVSDPRNWLRELIEQREAA